MPGDETPPAAATPAETTLATREDPLATAFSGKRWRIFGLTLWTGILTVLTLGIYRFWQKTRVRRWYWSAVRPGGHPLEYVGDPWEKLLGFLIAVVILSFYIGIVNLALMFVSFSLFQGNVTAYLLSLIGVFPIWFYARYRARRYVLARTRWMGLRFGLEPGAWGYAGRALWHGFLTIITLGLLWPRMTFWLEKYRTDRTWFGDHKMEQGGKWTMLFGALKWHFVTLGLVVLATLLLGAGIAPLAITLYAVAGLLLLYALVYYRVETLKRLTSAKRLGEMRLRLEASPFHVFLIFFFGYLSTLFLASIPTGFLALLFVEMQSLGALGGTEVGDIAPALEDADTWVLIALAVMSYFAIFLVWSAVSTALLTLPLTRHYARSLTIEGADMLPRIRQRPRDEHVEAEGFADALDVGASL
ncbi:hypothetical protein MAA8898_03488 [Maliponia aquimaris]|uniref:Inner membrane protein YjgN n=1 Tax=Maliponia aquimaris TaxID=1673631 RepID=A0A238KV82_9RHOB|nr:hypothetical protein MAA8898_03488 [Maliponia aquimaris]